MPKSRGPGGKNRKKAKSSSLETGRRELIFAEDGQTYAYVMENKGGGHYTLLCNDDVQRMGILRGKLWKRCWIRMQDVVLVTLRDYQDAKADIVHKFDSEEVLRLMSLGEISGNIAKSYNTGECDMGNNDISEDIVVFENSDDIDLSGI